MTTEQNEGQAVREAGYVSTGTFDSWVEHTPAQKKHATGAAGAAVVLLHGDLGVLQHMRGLEALGEGRRLVTYDRSGHGRSGGGETGWSYRGQADDLATLLDHLGIERAVLVGHSGGSNVAMEFALTHPQRLSAAVLIAGNYDGTCSSDEANEAFIGDGSKLRPPLEDMPPLEGRTSEERSEALLRYCLPLWKEAYLTPTDLTAISAPCLVMAGDHDVIDLTHTRTIFEAIPAAELAIVPGTTHGLPIERPQTVCALVNDFLERRTTA